MNAITSKSFVDSKSSHQWTNNCCLAFSIRLVESVTNRWLHQYLKVCHNMVKSDLRKKMALIYCQDKLRISQQICKPVVRASLVSKKLKPKTIKDTSSRLPLKDNSMMSSTLLGLPFLIKRIV